MQTEIEIKAIEASALNEVQGGAKGAAFNPLDPWGVGAFWANATATWMSFVGGPFSTPISPFPFGG
jgi:hypothetical protein